MKSFYFAEHIQLLNFKPPDLPKMLQVSIRIHQQLPEAAAEGVLDVRQVTSLYLSVFYGHHSLSDLWVKMKSLLNGCKDDLHVLCEHSAATENRETY